MLQVILILDLRHSLSLSAAYFACYDSRSNYIDKHIALEKNYMLMKMCVLLRGRVECSLFEIVMICVHSRNNC